MVVGCGLIATAFLTDFFLDYIIFATGIANSKINDLTEANKEKTLLHKYCSDNKNKTIIYFSTYSVNDSDLNTNLYVTHKLEMEEIVKNSGLKYYVIRTNNLVGNNLYDKSTIMNYLYHHIANNLEFTLWKNAYRNFLDVEHLLLMVKQLIKQQCTSGVYYLINPLSHSLLVVVSEFEKIIKVKANPDIVNLGNRFECDTSLSITLFNDIGLSTDNYLHLLLKKYYCH